MKLHLAHVAVGALLALTLLSGSVSFVAADPPPAPAPGTLLIVAGVGLKGSLGDNGPAIEARLNGPIGLATEAQPDAPNCVAVDSAGNRFASELNAHRVLKVTPEGIISTVAGSGKSEFSGEGGPATEAGLRGPMGLAIDAAGNLFITDTAWWTYYFDPADRFRMRYHGDGSENIYPPARK